MTISHFQKDLSLKRDLGEIIYLIIQYLSCVLESICIKFRRGKTNMNKKKHEFMAVKYHIVSVVYNK